MVLFSILENVKFLLIIICCVTSKKYALNILIVVIIENQIGKFLNQKYIKRSSDYKEQS